MELTLEKCIEKLKPWGGDKMFYEQPWVEKDFSDLEHETGCIVPNQLRSILEKYGAILTGEKEWMTATWPDGRVTANYTAGGVITGKDVMISNFKIFTLENSDPPALPFKMVFFDNVNGGNSQLLMSGTDLEDNRVFLWDNDNVPWGTETNTDGMALCANSLWEYLWNLKTEEEITAMGFDI